MHSSMIQTITLYRHPLALLVCLLMGLLVSGCHSGITPLEHEMSSCPQTVRITATVMGYSGASTRASTRAAADATETETGAFEPQSQEIATPNEGRIFFATLFVLPEQGNAPVAMKTFYNKALFDADTQGEITPQPDQMDLKQAAAAGTIVPFDVVQGSELTMSIDLKPGTYRFLLVANNDQVTTDALKGRTDHLFSQPIKRSENKLLWDYSSRRGYGLFWAAFSFVGEATIVVPESEPLGALTPEIPLERTHARLQVTLTTAKQTKGSRGLAYLTNDQAGNKYSPDRYQLTTCAVRATVRRPDLGTLDYSAYPSTLLPIKDDYSDEFTGVPALTRYTAGDFMTPQINYHPFYTAGILKINPHLTPEVYSTHFNKEGKLDKMVQRTMLFPPKEASGYTYKEGEMIYYYLPPIYSQGAKDVGPKTVAVDLTFTPTDAYKDELEELSYRIYLHNEADATDYYSVRRNTIYHLDLTFYGDQLYEYNSGIKVLPWRRVDQTIEVDPEGPGYQDNNITTKP